MASSMEVTQLRKAGQLEEALEMALTLMEEDPEETWNRRALAWVYYEMLKQAGNKGNVAAFLEQLKNIASLEMPGDENMLYNSIAFAIGRLVNKNDKIPLYLLDELFDLIRAMPFSREVSGYSYLLRAFNSQAGRWEGFEEFVNWWGLENLKEEDFKKFKTEEGRKIMALAEMVYISLAKKLLAEPVSEKKIREFIPALKRVHTANPDMDYVLYYLSKLLITIGEKEECKNYLTPFIRLKQRDFWVWDLFSEVFPKESEEYFSCLCKSLACGAPAKFTINVREKLAKILVAKDMLAEAKREYLDILDAREQEGWSLHAKHFEWQQYDWWDETSETVNNFKLYNDNKTIAEGLVYAHLPEMLIVVESVNHDKKALAFVMPGPQQGYFHYDKLKINPGAGEVYLVRMEQPYKEKSNFYKVHHIRQTTQKPPADIYLEVSGRLFVRAGNSFGHINKIFVPPPLINAHNLKDHDEISAIAVRGWNRAQKRWDWKAVKLIDKK